MKKSITAIALLALAGCANAADMSAISAVGELANIKGAISGAGRIVDTVRETSREVRESVSHDRMESAVYELCVGGTVGELDKLYARNPQLKELRPALCGSKPIAP